MKGSPGKLPDDQCIRDYRRRMPHVHCVLAGARLQAKAAQGARFMLRRDV